MCNVLFPTDEPLILKEERNLFFPSCVMKLQAVTIVTCWRSNAWYARLVAAGSLYHICYALEPLYISSLYQVQELIMLMRNVLSM